MTQLAPAFVFSYSDCMYRIKAEAEKGVIFVCTRCSHEVRVEDFVSSKGHPRTQAAKKMLEHLSSHGHSSVSPSPTNVFQRKFVEVGRPDASAHEKTCS